MTILKTLARLAVNKVANDPELRARISSTVQQEIVPRAKQGWKKAKPELEKAKGKAFELATKIKNKIDD